MQGSFAQYISLLSYVGKPVFGGFEIRSVKDLLDLSIVCHSINDERYVPFHDVFPTIPNAIAPMAGSMISSPWVAGFSSSTTNIVAIGEKPRQVYT
jgi:hypothetical protein